MPLSPADVKSAASARALAMVEDGMTLGLGTGSTGMVLCGCSRSG